ncbi:MAG: zinc ribbon domain-containing protein [Clostridia bacterium]|nr:zinc ribbon domain-containing protein [Clostridia bacterium]
MNTETFPICQSCGMPMRQDDQFGKNSDGTKNGDYCIYCCPNGPEHMEGTLEEMIAVCAKIETQMGLHPDEETARTRLAQYLPTLARWKKA